MSDQDAVVRALAEPATYAHAPERVEHVQTHISHVFLAGPYVYKLKKAVRFPFLDFATVERRRYFCGEEVRLNRRLAPEVYLDVVPVTRAADGRLRLGGAGEALDHVVWMRRLPAARMLVSLLRRDALRPDMLAALARRLAAFHATAPSGPEVAAHGEPALLAARWEENLAQAADFAGDLLPAEDHALLADFGPAFVLRHETLLRARQQAGRIREGHGDLHAEHVCFLEREPPGADGLAPLPPGIQVFDCIEFSQAFRCNDVASEIAFLAMDLTVLGRADLADDFVAAYAAAAPDPALPGLIPFYACARACIRGKVEALASRDPALAPEARASAADRARGHFALAVRYAWGAEGPGVIACAGLSGTGKTALARALAGATGFMHLATDVLRKEGGAGYTAAAREAVYRRLEADVAAALAAGRSVIADATFARRADRLRLAAVARRERRPLLFVECRADETTVHARLEAREGTATLSDARWDTYLAQRVAWEPLADDEPHVVGDTGGSLADARRATVPLLWAWRQGRRP